MLAQGIETVVIWVTSEQFQSQGDFPSRCARLNIVSDVEKNQRRRSQTLRPQRMAIPAGNPGQNNETAGTSANNNRGNCGNANDNPGGNAGR